jgi:hypothetical protein
VVAEGIDFVEQERRLKQPGTAMDDAA